MDEQGNKTGGRKKGTPNRATQALQAKCVELGVDPFHIVLLFAKGDHETLGYEKEQIKLVTESGEPVYELTISPELRQKSAKDACEYLHAKRKAIEHSGSIPDGVIDALDSVKDMTDEELKALAASAE